jgi:hypothetical protein
MTILDGDPITAITQSPNDYEWRSASARGYNYLNIGIGGHACLAA